MSHFSVLVIGPNVEEQLQPYHEFECTGTDDQYVQDVEQIEKFRELYETETKSRVRLPSGELVCDYDDQFYREPTEEETAAQGQLGFGSVGCRDGYSYSSKDWGDGKGYRAKIHLPQETIEVPVKELMSFQEFVEYETDRAVVQEGVQLPANPEDDNPLKYGYIKLNAEGEVVSVIDRTNPNAEWDWWQVGGRWSGFFKTKPHQSYREDGEVTVIEDVAAAEVNQGVKSVIDFEAMRNEAGAKASEKWMKAENALIAAGVAPTGRIWKSWVEVRESGIHIDEARVQYGAQPAVVAIRSAFDSWPDNLDQFLIPHADFVLAARNRAVSPYAVVHNGQWASKGERGWWGVSDEHMTQEDWNQKVSELIDSLPDDTLLTIVDCHI